MAAELNLHLFADGPSTPRPAEGPSGADLQRHARSVLTPSFVADAFRRAGEAPVAFALETATVQDVASAARNPDADVTVIVADATVGRRASADLVAELWREAPDVAAFLGGVLIDAGAVLFSPHAAGRIARTPPTPATGDDPLLDVLAATLAAGGTLKAVVTQSARSAGAASDPPRLVPDSPGGAWRDKADRIRRVFGGRLDEKSRERQADAAAIAAGLLCWHDLLDASHAVSQSIEGEGRNRAADYWHAIMHRREPDYGNAKYWFRRVGRHPIFAPLAERAVLAAAGCGPAAEAAVTRVADGGRWDPFAFVDACAEAERTGDREVGLALRRLQADEMLLLLRQTVRDARD